VFSFRNCVMSYSTFIVSTASKKRDGGSYTQHTLSVNIWRLIYWWSLLISFRGFCDQHVLETKLPTTSPFSIHVLTKDWKRLLFCVCSAAIFPAFTHPDQLDKKKGNKLYTNNCETMGHSHCEKSLQSAFIVDKRDMT
jgi:hypothetical protein